MTEPIESVALGARLLEPLMAVLTADLDELRATLGESCSGDERSVDLGTGSPHRGDDPPEHDLDVLGGEQSFDDSFVGARAHPARVGTATQEKRQGLHDHGLPRSGLAGQSGHPWAERETKIGDHTQIADSQLYQHRGFRLGALLVPARDAAIPPPGDHRPFDIQRSLSPNFSRSTRWNDGGPKRTSRVVRVAAAHVTTSPWTTSPAERPSSER